MLTLSYLAPRKYFQYLPVIRSDNFINSITVSFNFLPTPTSISYLWTYDLYGPVCNAFDAVRATPLRGLLGEGWALEIETF
jgi:hypothetical protein